MGSTTTQDQSAARDSAADHVAFHSGDGVGVLIANFRSSIPSPSVPLFTLHRALRSARRKTRDRVDRYSFLVRLFHPLSHAGLSRRTVMAIYQQLTFPRKPTLVGTPRSMPLELKL